MTLDAKPYDRAAWALIDQGIVSLGNIALQLLLARNLDLAKYGEFALLFGVLLCLQIINASFFSYPLAVRMATVAVEMRPHVVSSTVANVALSSAFLTIVLIAGLVAFERAALIQPASCFFLAWQVQEALRRGLLAEFKYRKAVFGDMVAYLGGPLLLLAMAWLGRLSLDGALYIMATSFAVSAVLQCLQQKLARPSITVDLRSAGQIWEAGKWFIMTSLLILLGVQIPLWILAAGGGPDQVAALQAVVNIANLLNPLIIGIGNIIPQATSEARLSGGLAAAWRVSRGYIGIGLMPTILISMFAIALPDLLLRIFYGAASPFLVLSLSIQLITLLWPARFASEIICVFLVSIDGGRQAVIAHASGILVTIAALPLSTPYGIAGFAFAIAIGAVARLLLGLVFVRSLVSSGAPGQERSRSSFRAQADGRLPHQLEAAQKRP